MSSLIFNVFLSEKLIEKNFDVLVSNLDCKSLVGILFEKKVISWSEMAELTEDKSGHRVNEKLLHLLAGKPLNTFRHFLEALKRTKQNDIYSLLLEQGTYFDFLHIQHNYVPEV